MQGVQMNMKVFSLVLLTVVTAPLVVLPAREQSPVANPNGWMLPRTPDGQPDLQGVWANNTATPLQRPEAFADRAELSEEELATLRQRLAELRDSEQAGNLLGDRLIQQALDDPNFTPFDPETGNYNSFWLVEREIDNRTSLIEDPPAGRIPDLTPDAREKAEARRAYREAHPADGPEDRGLGDRCLIFATPRMGAGYNSYFQILQTPRYVAILQEMGHQARMIPIDGRPHLSDDLRQWNGDSRGRWDADTLVIETTNFSAKSGFRGSTENLHLVERYTRVGPDTIKQEITLEDPATWTSPWTVIIYLKRSSDQLFEVRLPRRKLRDGRHSRRSTRGGGGGGGCAGGF